MTKIQKVHYIATENRGFSVISLPPGVTPWTGYRVCGGPYKSKAYAQRVADKKNYQQEYPKLYAESQAQAKRLRQLTRKWLKEISHAQ